MMNFNYRSIALKLMIGLFIIGGISGVIAEHYNVFATCILLEYAVGLSDRVIKKDNKMKEI